MRPVVLFCLLILTACSAPGPELIVPEPLPVLAGPVSRSATLSGDVVLSDDVRVLPGVELVLAPGTTVWVRPAGSTKIEPDQLSARTEILVEGSLVLAGRPGAPVRFRLLKPPLPVPDDDPLWGGVLVLSGGQVRMSDVEIDRAEHGLWLLGGKAEVTRLDARNCRYGLELGHQAGLTLEEGRIQGGELGLFCTGSAQVSLDRMVFEGMDEAGLHLASGCSLKARQVVVRDSRVGLVAEDIPDGVQLMGNGLDLIRPGSRR